MIFCNVYAENKLTEIKTIPLPDNRIRLDFNFTDKISTPPASFITEKPARIILDFNNTVSSLTDKEAAKKIELGSLLKYQVLTAGNRTRAILDLTGPSLYSSSIVNRSYQLTLSGKGHRIFRQRKEIAITNRSQDTKYRINDINFRGTDNQGGKVIVTLNSTSAPIEINQIGKNIIARFNSTETSSQLLRQYDVTDFHSPAQMISAEQTGKNTVITVRNQGDYGYFSYQVNKQFIIDIFPLSDEEKRLAKLRKKVFTGKRLSLNFQNIEVRAVLQLIAEFTGTNVVVSDKVGGAITLRLNDVPWDQALDIILTTQGLDKRISGNVMLIAPANEIAKREQNELRTQQAFIALAPLRSDLLQINYAKAADVAVLLKDKNNSLLSKRGSLSVDTRTNTIWIQDTGEQIEVIRDLIKQLDIPVKQVLIEARIVDVTKTFTQDLGIQFGISRAPSLSGTLAGANQVQANIAGGDTPMAALANVSPYNERLNLDLAALPTGVSPASVGLALAKLGNDILLDLELSALESEGLAEIIASPRLITTNQQPAIIESGQEIPYQESTSSGATSVAFKKAVLSLKVTPQITPDNKILLELQVNQDTPSAQLFNGVPSILTKEIQTNVLVDNGQTIVLGGIYQKNKSNAINRVPFFGELPVLGQLFRNDHVSLTNEELLIFITPRIISDSLAISTIEGPKKAIDLDKFGKPLNDKRDK